MSLCSHCGASFGCAMTDGATGPCWCTELPAVVALPDAAGTDAACWCPACLRAHIADTGMSNTTKGPEKP